MDMSRSLYKGCAVRSRGWEFMGHKNELLGGVSATR